MDKQLPNFKHMTGQDGKVYGIYDTVTSVNPYNCRFIVKYPDGKVIKGNNLFETGWDDIPNGFIELSYVLSTGKIIVLPKFKAYLPLIECSLGVDGSRIFHSINVKCLEPNSVQVWKIILKQDNLNTRFKIGDIILGREPLPKYFSKSWKYTS
jgi:hypothetical protein